MINLFEILSSRLHDGQKTIAYPKASPVVPDRLRGRPIIDQNLCPIDCRKCVDACPSSALSRDGSLRLDLGRCLFCTDCVETCPHQAIKFTNDYRLATSARENLLFSGDDITLAKKLDEKMIKVFGRSLQFRLVSAGGCNGCEVDVDVLTTVVFDLSRFGIKIVASPRHADGLIIIGPISANMKEATIKTYQAIPSPKLVVAIGACAISGGPYRGHPEQENGITELLPVDLFIPGCPPHPLTILDGLLRLLGKIKVD